MTTKKAGAERPTAQHTPGPWTLEFHDDEDGQPCFYILGRFTATASKDCVVATVETWPDLPQGAQEAATARLIAAAPELLALALRAHGDLCGCQSMGDDCGWPDARAAIRKATEGA